MYSGLLNLLNRISNGLIALKPFLVHAHEHGEMYVHIIINPDDLFVVVKSVETTGVLLERPAP